MVTPDLPHEKRRYERCMLRTKATIILSSGQEIEVPTIDISRGGVGIIASVNPPMGAQFNFRVPLMLKPKGLVLVESHVIVMHSILAGSAGGFKVGLQFVALNESLKSAIDAFIQQSPLR